MRILLINPWEGEVFPPPSLGYLQAVIKTMDNVEVLAHDLHDALLLKDTGFDITCVSFHSFSVKHARMIRKTFKGRLICGGHHPSALPQQMLDEGYDQVVIGEGEHAIKDIINGNTNKLIAGQPVDINKVPFPDYTGFGGKWEMGLPIISSRGCLFTCSFCASSDFWDRLWKMRTPENVIQEILSTGYKQFMFEDDNFTLKRSRAIEICTLLRDIDGLSWQCASRAEMLDEELCWNLRQSGCNTVWLGVESLSQDSLDRCKKNTTVDRMLKGIENAEKAGIQTMSQFIIGLPGDTEKNIMETVRNIQHSYISRKGTNILWILPNTDVYRKAKVFGFNDEVYLQNGAPFYIYEQDINTLIYWADLINSAK